MAYIKASAILPEELISEIQKYVQGDSIYIPKPKMTQHKWGTCSGTRKMLSDRNKSIKSAFKNGKTVGQLADEYHLSVETIKKIVYTNK